MADNNHNLDGIQVPTLEETTYDPSKSVKHSLDGIQAPTLDDTAYVPEKKSMGLNDVAAPILEDTYTPNTVPQAQPYGTQNVQQPQFQQYGVQNTQQPQFQQYGAQNSQQPQFQQYGAQNSQQPQFQQYGAQNSQQPQFQQYGAQNSQQAQFQQYGAQNTQQSVQNQSFSQTTSRNLDDVQKPVLDDEPAVQDRYVPKFVDPDLEAAKKQAKDRAIKSSLNSVPESFDKEKSREMYREFMREKEADMAKKGGMQVIILMVLGMISGLLTLFFSFGKLKPDMPGIIDTFNMCYIILGIVFILGAALMLVKSTSTQKASSQIFTFGTILHVIPGIVVMFSKASKATSVPFYLIVLILNIAICFVYGSSETIKKHYNGHGRDEYY